MGLKKPVPVKGNPLFYWMGTKDLSFYREHFEQHLIEKAREEYKNYAQHRIAESSAPDYLSLAEKAYSHEEVNCDELL